MSLSLITFLCLCECSCDKDPLLQDLEFLCDRFRIVAEKKREYGERERAAVFFGCLSMK